MGFIRDSAPTYDEPVHLATGYTDLVTGSYRLNAMDHPPFAEMWAALPLLALKPGVSRQNLDWISGRVYNYSDFFLYENNVDAEKLLDTARAWCLVTWTFLLGLGILAWARREAGAAGWVCAAVLFAFCPPIFSNAALVTTDTASTVFFFLSFWILSHRPRSTGRWACAGLAIGLAMASKFSMAFLPLLAGAIFLGERGLEKKLGKGKLPVLGLLAAAGTAVVVLAFVYRIGHLPLYVKGLLATVERLGQGRGSFLLGSHSTTGSLFYFPIAILVKTPIPTLIAAAAGVFVVLRRPRETVWLWLPPAVYFLLALTSKTQIGYRHILPVYPFLIVLGACGAAWAWEHSKKGRGVVVALGLWLAVSVINVHPHHLAYFNEAAGGPSAGHRILVDSNLDWGQGLKGLAAKLKEMGNPPVYLSYFGVADPSYYGIRYFPVAPVTNVDRRDGVVAPSLEDPVLLAISATNLQSVYYGDKEVFSWLKERTPLHIVGHALFLYDLTEDPEGARKLARILAGSGHPSQAQSLLKKSQLRVRGQ